LIRTELCERLGIKYPLIQAGMGPFGTNRLCIACANAGVLGLISASALEFKFMSEDTYEMFKRTFEPGIEGPTPAETLKNIFRRTLERTRESGGIFGVNVMVSEEVRGPAEEMIRATLEVREDDPEMRRRLRVLVTSAGNPVPWAEMVKSSDIFWMHVVPSVRAARKCVEAGVDGIIASGHEGGFHVAWEPLHTMTLLPAVVEACPGVPVVGAGGFCDGKTLVAALALGAQGVQMGTRFLCTQESDFVDLWKESILKAGDRGTVVARGIVGPARYIRSPFSEEMVEVTVKYSPGVYTGRPDDLTTVPLEVLLKEMEGFSATYRGDRERALTAGGECAQRINDLPTVKELVERIMGEAEETLARLRSL